MKTKRILLLCLCSLVILYSIPGFAKEANKQTAKEKISLEGYPLSLQDAIVLTLKNNFDIEVARLGRSINSLNVPIARSIYDTTLTADFGYTVDETELTTSRTDTTSHSTTWDVGLAKTFAWGPTVGINYSNVRSSSSASTAVHNPYYASDLSVSVLHPLLNNSFGLVNRTNIQITELNVSARDLTLLDTIERNLATVMQAYWDLYFAQERFKAQQEALRFAESFLSITQDQFSNGAAEETDLFAAEANVEQQKSNVLQTRNAIANASDELKFAMNTYPEYIFRATDTPTIKSESYTQENSYMVALENRRDYKAALLDVEAQRLTVKVKQNQKLPEIDLVATYTANGFAREMIDAAGEAASSDDPTYFIGATFSVPLENTKANSETQQAELAKAQSLWEVKKIERTILNDIRNDVRSILLKQKQTSHLTKVRDLQEKKLAGEEKKYGFGRSSSDTIIRFQNDVIQAQISLAQALSDYEKAIINLERNQNTLLATTNWQQYETIDRE